MEYEPRKKTLRKEKPSELEKVKKGAVKSSPLVVELCLHSRLPLLLGSRFAFTKSNAGPPLEGSRRGSASRACRRAKDGGCPPTHYVTLFPGSRLYCEDPACPPT